MLKIVEKIYLGMDPSQFLKSTLHFGRACCADNQYYKVFSMLSISTAVATKLKKTSFHLLNTRDRSYGLCIVVVSVTTRWKPKWTHSFTGMSYLENQNQHDDMIVNPVFLSQFAFAINKFWSWKTWKCRHLNNFLQLQTLITANWDITQKNYFYFHNLVFMPNLIL